MDPEVCQGFATDEVKAALSNINPSKPAGPDKVPVAAQPGPCLHLPADKYLQQIVGGDLIPSCIDSSRHQTNTKMKERPTED